MTPEEHKTRRKDSIANTLLVALAVSLVCSVLVASASVLLQPLQHKNEVLYRQKVILDVVGLLDPETSVEELFADVETRLVDLETGQYVEDIPADTFDPRKAAKDPALMVVVPPEIDIARVKTRARYAPVYLFRDDEGELDYIVLPVNGYGLWSTMWGFIALEGDANTVAGLRFFEHAETPGLGAEIDNPRWLALWPGQLVYDDEGTVRIEVIRGPVNPDAPESQRVHQIDGMSGATLTGNGVTNMLHYWLSQEGFAPYLKRIQEQGA